MPAVVANRIRAVLFDWLTMLGYLLFATALLVILHMLIFDSLRPSFSAFQAQVIAVVAGYLPLVGWFSWKESRIPYASFGKQEFGVQVSYTRNPIASAVVRNLFKFLPWLLVLLGAVQILFYSDGSSSSGMMLTIFGVFLGATYIMQALVTPSHRHLADLIAGARITPMGAQVSSRKS